LFNDAVSSYDYTESKNILNGKQAFVK